MILHRFQCYYYQFIISLSTFTFLKLILPTKKGEGCDPGVKWLNCRNCHLEVNEFEPQLVYYFHFWINIAGKVMAAIFCSSTKNNELGIKYHTKVNMHQTKKPICIYIYILSRNI